MALVREYEVPSTGLVAPNAYHVIKKITTEKRLHDVPAPPDPSRTDGVTPTQQGHEVYWKKGYVGRISEYASTIDLGKHLNSHKLKRDPFGTFDQDRSTDAINTGQ